MIFIGDDVMADTKQASIRINFIYNTAYQFLAILIPLITTPYLSRRLGAEQLGTFSFANTIAYYFALFSMLGVNNYGNRSIAMVSNNKEQLSIKFLEIYAFQLLVSIICIAIYFMYCEIGSFDKKISLIFLMYVISSAFDINWFFFGMEKFKITTIRNASVKLFTIVLIFIFVKTPEDVYKYALIYCSGILISQIIMWISVKKYIIFRKITIEGILSHIKPNLMLFIPVIAVSVYKFMDKIMLGIMATKTEVGLYECADRMILVPSVLINSLGTVMLPRISNLFANNKKSVGLSYLSKSIRFESFLASSLSFGIMSVASVFVPLYYGPGFEKCISLFYILLPSCIFVGFANVLRTQYMIPNQMDIGYTVSVLSGTIINLTLNCVFIPQYGSVGAAIATLIAEIVVCIIHCAFVFKALPIVSYIKISMPAIISGAVMFCAVYNLNLNSTMSWLVQLVVEVCVGALIFVFVYSLFNFKYIIQLIRRAKTRRRN